MQNPQHLLLVAAASLVALSGPAAAQFPEDTVRIVVPFPPGGASDVVGRVLAQALGQELDADVIVENRGGASGSIGTALVAAAEPDGYTLLLGSTGAMSTAVTMRDDLEYDPVEDFTPVSLVAMVPTVLVATEELQVESVNDLDEYVLENPGELNYGSPGIGTTQHLSGLMYADEIGGELVHIPYRGQDNLIPDLVSGSIHLSFTNIAAISGQLGAGQLKALAVALPERWSGLPDVPTFAEAGLPDMELSSWLGLFAPAGTPEDIVSVISEATQAAVSSPEVRAKLEDAGVQPIGSTGPELADFHQRNIALWADAVQLIDQ